MSLWDLSQNEVPGYGYLSFYISDYGTDDGATKSFSYSRLEKTVDMAVEQFGEHEEISDLYDLIGLNSNSFTSSARLHHVFAEWDNDDNIPTMDYLQSLGGIITLTGRGVHLVREDSLDLGTLLQTLKEWRCCPGFIKATERKRCATLRVSPKGDNRLHITNEKEGAIYEVYRTLVNRLHGRG